MEKYKRLGKNTVLVAFGNIGSKIVSFLMLPFYTKWLTVSDYGIVDLVGIYMSFLIPIITFSISEAIFIFPKLQNQLRQKEYFSSGLGFSALSFLATFIAFWGGKVIFNKFEINNIFTQYTWIIYGLVITSFFQNYTQQFLRSLDKIFSYAVTGISLTIFIAFFSIILVPKYGIMGYISAQIISSIAASIYSLLSSNAYKYFDLGYIRKSSIYEMLKYSIPLIPNGIMWWLIAAFNRPILEYYLDLHAIGLFAVSNKIPTILTVIFSVFFYSWQISVIEEFQKDGYKEFYNRILRIIFTLLIMISCGFAVFSKIFIEYFVDEKFFDAWKYVPILSFAVIFTSLSGIAGSNFSATRESKYYFYSSIWGAFASIIANILFIPLLGLLGAALSIVIGHGAMAISRIGYSWKHVQIENLSSYLLMLLLNIIVIIDVLAINQPIIRNLILIICVIFFLLINASLKKDLSLFYHLLKSKLQKTNN